METLYQETNSIQALSSLKTIEQTIALNEIGIYSLRDLSEFAPCRYTEILLGSLKNGNIGHLKIEEYLQESIPEDEFDSIGEKEISSVIGVDETISTTFKNFFQIETIRQLAVFDAFLEAKKLISNEVDKIFYEKPSAPNELIPKMIGSTQAKARFSNYIKEEEHVIEASVIFSTDFNEKMPDSNFLDIFRRTNFKFNLGYLASIKQVWINSGTNLGEILHSIALAPGESRNIAVLDWYARQTSSRSEQTTESEVFQNEFLQTRALNEVVRSSAQEHLFGMSSTDAATKTSGFGITAGHGSSTAGSIGGMLGNFVGSLTKSVASSIGASFVNSNSSTQGVLQSETTGEREVVGEVVQNISDSTVQNASNVRSIMSTVIIEDQQSGGQSAQTRNITNYNHSHALTMQYYEVLHRYNIDTFAEKVTPVIFIPFQPLDFSFELIEQYWSTLSALVKQKVNRSKFTAYDNAVRDYNPINGVFDVEGKIYIDEIQINSSHAFNEDLKIQLGDEEEHVATLSGADLTKIASLALKNITTYFEYDFLNDSSHSISSFNGSDLLEINGSIIGVCKIDFRNTLKSVLLKYISSDKITFEIAGTRTGQENVFNFGMKSLIEREINAANFKVLNEDGKIDIVITLKVDLLDEYGNKQTHSFNVIKSISYKDLQSETEIQLFNLTDEIESFQVDEMENGTYATVDEIVNHITSFKYEYTKYLLINTEKEQIIDVIEHLSVSSSKYYFSLTEILDPNPIGIVENLMIFKLKKIKESSFKLIDTYGFYGEKSFQNDVFKLNGITTKKRLNINDQPYIEYTIESNLANQKSNQLGNNKKTKDTLLVSLTPNTNGKYDVKGKSEIITLSLKNSVTTSYKLEGEADSYEGSNIEFDLKLITPTLVDSDLSSIPSKLDLSFQSFLDSGESKIPSLINEYLTDLKGYEQELLKSHIKDVVYLPSSGVFGEAILGLSNASEYLNIRRFYNWQDSPIPNSAPSIASVSVNENYAQPISDQIAPNSPQSIINQISPQAMPATSLQSALSAIQNGAMFNDMSKTEQLTATLSKLADLANNTAQLAGTLSGEAAANALNGAIELGKSISTMSGDLLKSNTNSPPSNSTKAGERVNAMDEMKENATTGELSNKDKAIADNVYGVPIDDDSDKSGSGENIDWDTEPEDIVVETVDYGSVFLDIEKVTINQGTKLSDIGLSILNTVMGVWTGDPPSWWIPEFWESFQYDVTIVIEGKARLKSDTGIVTQSKSFQLGSDNAFMFLAFDDDLEINSFVEKEIKLTKRISNLGALNEINSQFMIHNISDPVDYLDLLGFLLYPFASVGGDEVEWFSRIWDVAQLENLLLKEMAGSNSISSFFDKINFWRDNFANNNDWSKGLRLYLSNYSTSIDTLMPDVFVDEFFLLINIGDEKFRILD